MSYNDEVKKYLYTKDNPPPSCVECEWHTFTYYPETDIRTLWADYCSHLKLFFGKMHIILRGEYRALKRHDEDDLKHNLPYECPYFDSSKVFWEMYGIIQMGMEMFIYECTAHPYEYYGDYVYSLRDNINDLMYELPDWLGLHYLYVEPEDEKWFLDNHAETTVLISDINPVNWEYPVPPDID